MRFSSLQDWLAWQETCHPQEIDLGLERIREVAERLNLVDCSATVITVAGTNGKGSCVATLEALLDGRGERVGAYTSPHLLRYNERVRLQMRAAEDDALCRAFAAIDEAREAISLSYFEFGTLAALWLFREYQLDYWLLEVGLGGRLDATNILDADIAIVTSIALDHQQFLGNDRETIGREKAGIFRSGRPVVCADPQPPESLIKHAHALHCPLLRVGKDFKAQAVDQQWHVNLQQGEQARQLVLPEPRLPPASVAAALQALALLDKLPPQHQLSDALQALQLAGRFQRLSRHGRTVIVDVAHNPAAAEFLATRLPQAGVTAANRAVAVVAIMADKDIAGCLQPLLPLVVHWHLGGLPDLARAASPQQLQQILTELGVDASQISCHDTVAAAMSRALTEGEGEGEGPLLVTGSFYTVAAAMPELGEPA